ncbi:MAG TPA: HD domain-containing protein [Solirubrobacteraceae bacterium]|nr:HD domain-containing protein [Solirubrobacteraceae bacterium]
MSDGLRVARAALADRRAWVVGGALRDRALGRSTADVDIVLDGDPAAGARAVARAAGGAACFALSVEFGAWRVIARDRSWQVDIEPLRADTLEADLALRDFTANAIAEPIGGGEPVDPLGGLADLSARLLRMAGPGAFSDDPVRVLRLVRVSIELDLTPDPATLRAAAATAPALAGVSPERVFIELRRVVSAERAVRGLELMAETGATAVVLPELQALRGVQQSRFHHLDVYEHTIEVLAQAIALSRDPAPLTADEADAIELRSLLSEPLADELTRSEALRWGALLHDAAKPLTREERPGDGRVTFLGHDVAGADLARRALGRLRSSERLRGHVAALVRHHLRLGFLVHEPQPLSRRTVFTYLYACSPVEVDVTLLSVADRLATRGERADESIQAHVALARGMLHDALRWRAQGPPAPLLGGDELIGELGVAPGPVVGELLARLAEAQYAGEITTRDQALALARRELDAS